MMSERHGTMTRLFAIAPLCMLACLTSCKTAESPGSSTWKFRGEGATATNGSDHPLNKPAGDTQSSWVRSAVVPLGAVPHDNGSLPLVSSDGRYVATQTGIAPSWPTVIAGAEAAVPSLTRIEVYELDRRELIEDSRRPPQLLYAVSEPALLGRSSDGEGFLIESPREDGSRWVGHVSWTSGEIVWLLDDDHVNAFASLGPDGRIAWSRRAVDAAHFDLVVRHGDSQWTQSSSGDDDWLMPQWSGRGDGLFCLRLSAGDLEIVFANASSLDAFRLSLRTYPLGPQATVSTAYQALTGQTTAVDAVSPSRDQLVYFHPWLERIALWRPLAGTGRTAMWLNPSSFMAVMVDDDVAIVATDEKLVRQRLSNPRDQIELLKGAHAIRPTAGSAWSYLLLSPGEGEIGLVGLRLLPINEMATRR
jgi:hypothetical protein